MPGAFIVRFRTRGRGVGEPSPEAPRLLSICSREHVTVFSDFDSALQRLTHAYDRLGVLTDRVRQTSRAVVSELADCHPHVTPCDGALRFDTDVDRLVVEIAEDRLGFTRWNDLEEPPKCLQPRRMLPGTAG